MSRYIEGGEKHGSSFHQEISFSKLGNSRVWFYNFIKNIYLHWHPTLNSYLLVASCLEFGVSHWTELDDSSLSRMTVYVVFSVGLIKDEGAVRQKRWRDGWERIDVRETRNPLEKQEACDEQRPKKCTDKYGGILAKDKRRKRLWGYMGGMRRWDAGNECLNRCTVMSSLAFPFSIWGMRLYKGQTECGAQVSRISGLWRSHLRVWSRVCGRNSGQKWGIDQTGSLTLTASWAEQSRMNAEYLLLCMIWELCTLCLFSFSHYSLIDWATERMIQLQRRVSYWNVR